MNMFSFRYAIILAWLLCAVVMLNADTYSSKIQYCNQKDMHALLNFKQRVIDPSGVLSSWTSAEQDCCEWRGVTCENITHRVTQLNLTCSSTFSPYADEDKSHCLTGSIYLSFVDFEFLNYLDLRNNDFLSIHFDFVDSQDCHNLSVANPLRKCANSSVLHYLDLSFNKNLAINSLQWLSHFSSLEYLNLATIDLHNETNWLQLVTLLPSLSVLMFCDCQLDNISPSLQHANFTALEVLDLSYNHFHSELPKWLFNLSHGISHINLYNNMLRGQLPKTLPNNLGYLELLDLSFNGFTGPIPDWLGQLEHLQDLFLNNNLFSGSIPASLGNLSSLVSLSVETDQSSGVVSERNFAKLSKLKDLKMLSSPPLIFDFDSQWIPPFQLEQLFFEFAGPKLPAWLYTQRSIDFLSIFNSRFKAPSEFWNFVSGMTMLCLKNNSIDGNLSNVLLNSTFIVLSSNDLKGGLPQLSSNVVVVDMSRNSLSGAISPLLCDDHKMLNGKNNLMYLDISRNLLSGGLSNCWKNWKSLVSINLGGNHLKGKIPSSMGLLSNLTSLHLHENKLYGEIPPSLQSCHSLLVFNVRENNFSGNIPNWIPQTAKAVQLRSNQFNGSIPPQICQMTSLIILDIADNRVSGDIPNCLNNITTLVSNNASLDKFSFLYFFPRIHYFYFFQEHLEIFTKGQQSQYQTNLHFMCLVDLSSNDLSGIIPPQVFSLTGLHTLNLSFNKLVGRIPQEIGKMKNLESLDLSRNQLQGAIPESMSGLSFLGFLNLSFNNFTGKIPSGTQLQGFTSLSYAGNPYLCGPPLPKNCSQNVEDRERNPIDEDENEDEFMTWFYTGIASGFVIGYLGVCGAIFFNGKLRHVYFNFIWDLKLRLT